MEPELDTYFPERPHQGQVLKYYALLSQSLSYFTAKDQIILLSCSAALKFIFNRSSTMTHTSSAESLLSRWVLLSQKYHEHPLLLELPFTTVNTMVCFDWPYQRAWTVLPQQLLSLHCTHCSKNFLLNMDNQSQISFIHIIYKEKPMRS